MPPLFRISVALCTFNGERFLPAQLSSILMQTRLPDEVVFCDDGSTDSTLSLLKNFAQDAPFPVRVEVNPTNLGSTKNFEKAVALCKGELIAFSDQDDLWSSNRLKDSEAAFAKDNRTGLVFSDATLIDAQDVPAAGTLWQHYQFGAELQAELASGDYLPLMQWRFVTGATVTVRAQLARACFPAGEGWIHDEWLAAAVPLFADVVPLSERLISYRLHASQQIGATRQRTFLDKLLGLVREITDRSGAEVRHWGVLRMVEQRSAVLCERFPPGSLSAEGRVRWEGYAGYVQWLRSRLALPANRLQRLPHLFRLLPVYRTYSRWGSIVEDLLTPKLENETLKS